MFGFDLRIEHEDALAQGRFVLVLFVFGVKEFCACVCTEVFDSDVASAIREDCTDVVDDCHFRHPEELPGLFSGVLADVEAKLEVSVFLDEKGTVFVNLREVALAEAAVVSAVTISAPQDLQ